MGPVNLRNTGELADGWLPIWFSPSRMDTYAPHIEEGFRRAGNGKSWKDFAVVAGCTVMITDDVKAGLATMKPHLALYMGGMGAKSKNFHNDTMIKYGYADEAKRVQELYLSGRKKEAEDEIPDEFADEMSLVGPVERIKERFKAWEDAGVTTMLVNTRQREALHLMADITGVSRGNTE